MTDISPSTKKNIKIQSSRGTTELTIDNMSKLTLNKYSRSAGFEPRSSNEVNPVVILIFKTELKIDLDLKSNQ